MELLLVARTHIAGTWHTHTLDTHASIDIQSHRARCAQSNGSILSNSSSTFQRSTDESNLSPLRILFAAGGTGGHVYPAISIAQELRNLQPNIEIEFVGTKQRMESVAVPKAGFKFNSIQAAGLRRPIFTSPENIFILLRIFLSFLDSWRIISRFRPHIVVGTGGYVSGPVCLVASLRRLPVVIQEQNASPGLTNKILGIFVNKVFIAFAAAAAHFPKGKCIVSGNPTRLRLNRSISSLVARTLFFPKTLEVGNVPSEYPQTVSGYSQTSPDYSQGYTQTATRRRMQVVLILGGSQGARSINSAFLNILPDMLRMHPRRFVIWQTGDRYFEEVSAVFGCHDHVSIHGFIDSMETAYAAADLVVARAGAITCSEIMNAGKPSLLIPSPNVTDDHQMTNARSMEKAGIARVLRDNLVSSSPSILAKEIDELMDNQEGLKEMGIKGLKQAIPDAGGRIASHVIQLATPGHVHS